MGNPEMGGYTPQQKESEKPFKREPVKFRKLFEIEETFDGKFIVFIPTKIVERIKGKPLAETGEDQIFNTREEAEAKVGEVQNNLDLLKEVE